MINLDLIEFADLVRPKQIVDEIIRQIPDIPIPVPLEEIAHAVGIQKIEYQQLDGFEGALIANPEKSQGAILINSGARHHRQRFSLGHELGHFMIPRHGYEMRCSLDDFRTLEGKQLSSRQKIEMEANQFSAELLMPDRQFRRYEGFEAEPSMHCLINQATGFDVSFESCAQRYCNLHSEPVAIIFSHNGVVRYPYKGQEFPFWIVPGKGDPLPPVSFTKKVLGKTEDSVYSDNSYSSNWINGSRHYEIPDYINEEVYILKDGYAATMLSFDEELEEIE